MPSSDTTTRIVCLPSYALVVSGSISSAMKARKPHIHIQAADDQAKFWLEPIRLAANYGFAARDLNEIERIIREHQSELLEAWDEYFS